MATQSLKQDHRKRIEAAIPLVKMGKVVDAANTVKLLETVIRPFDKVNIEGNNQKQADFLAKCLCQVDKNIVHDIHMVQSALAIDAHLDVFENGIAVKADFAFAGPQAKRLAQFMQEGKIQLGGIHTYLELYARYFVDLTPRVAMICACQADINGNLFTGFNTEDTPVVVEATKFRQGVVIAQVNEIVDSLPRIDIPGDWVDFVVQSPEPFYVEPLFTRDPAMITDAQVLRAMIALKGIYAEYGVQRLNHGIGFDTAAIELLLPTYGEELGLKGKICSHFVLNPHPTLIPAIESGWVKSVYAFGGEVGMEDYVKSRPIYSLTGPTIRCDQTGLLHRWRDTTQSTCSSAELCRSTNSAIPAQPRPGEWQDSVAHPIWVAIRADDGTRRKHGLSVARRTAYRPALPVGFPGGDGWSCNCRKLSARSGHRALSISWMPGNLRKSPISTFPR